MTERTTVLYPVTDLTRDGAQRQLFELVRGLDKDRFRPIVLSFEPGGPMEREFSSLPGVRVLSIQRRSKYDFLCMLRVARILRSMKVDVIQPFLTPATFIGLVPALLCRTKVKIVTERAGPGNKSTGRGYRIYLKMEDLLSRFADRAVPNSQAGREYLIRRGVKPSRIAVIYNGIDQDRLESRQEDVEAVRDRLGVPPGGKVVGVAARFFPVKNHAMFLRAAALIDTELPDTRYALLGDGPLRGDLESLSRELGLGSKVTFLGEQQQVGSYLAAFDIAALTSDTEGCSNSLLEAMAKGKPVVATDVGGNREVVRHGETGILVPAGNVEAMAEAVMTLLRDPQKAQDMGRCAKSVIDSQFDRASMVRRYEALYENAMRSKGGRHQASAAEREAAEELLLLSATSRLAKAARERMSVLLERGIDWEHLTELAAFHALAPLLARNLADSGLMERTPRVHASELERARSQTLHRNVILSSETEKVLSLLEQRGVMAIPLKGTVLAECLYDHVGMRPGADMDVLVRPHDLPVARACLLEEGYNTVAEDSLLNHPFHGAPFFKKKGGGLVLELHWALDDGRVTAFCERDIWDRAELLVSNGISIHTLSPEDNLLFLAHHFTKHDSGLLKLLCDIAELLKKYEGSLDWDYIAAKARSWGIETAVYYSLRRAQELLDAPVPRSPYLEMRPGLLRWWLLDLLVDRRTLVSPVKRRRLRNETFILAHSLMMKRPRQTMAALTRDDRLEGRRTWYGIVWWAALSLGAASVRRFCQWLRARDVRVRANQSNGRVRTRPVHVGGSERRDGGCR